VDKKGEAYVTGHTESSDFPTQNPIYKTYTGNSDAFITKINNKGNALVYSTYLGGSEEDRGNSIALDKKAAVYVTGYTESSDFPTKNPFQGNYVATCSPGDAFITKINSKGNSLVYSTYLGAPSTDEGYSIAVNKKCEAYVTGRTYSSGFPTKNPIFDRKGKLEIFITKLNKKGNKLVYSTFLSGSDNDCGYGIALDKKSAAYVTGYTESSDFPTKYPFQGNKGGNSDVFIAKINSKGNSLVYSTYLGASSADEGYSIAVNKKCEAYVTGRTLSMDFPTKNPIFGYNSEMEVFVTKLNKKGNALVYSTFLGGSGDEWGYGIAVDRKSAVYVTGYTDSTDFPTKDAIQTNNAGQQDVFVTKIK